MEETRIAAVTVEKIKPREALDDIVDGGSVPDDVLGNERADEFARKGAELHAHQRCSAKRWCQASRPNHGAQKALAWPRTLLACVRVVQRSVSFLWFGPLGNEAGETGAASALVPCQGSRQCGPSRLGTLCTRLVSRAALHCWCSARVVRTNSPLPRRPSLTVRVTSRDKQKFVSATLTAGEVTPVVRWPRSLAPQARRSLSCGIDGLLVVVDDRSPGGVFPSLVANFDESESSCEIEPDEECF